MEINENLICKKIFISHSSRDAEFGQAIVELLLGIGMDGSKIIFTGDPQYGIPANQNIFDYLKSQINEDAYMLYLLSNNYYNSIACLNEMGAAWVKQNRYSLLMIPGFDSTSPRFQQGAANPRQIAAQMDNKKMMEQFARSIQQDFCLAVNEAEFQAACDKYYKRIEQIKEIPQNLAQVEKSLRFNSQSAVLYQEKGYLLYCEDRKNASEAIKDILYAIYLDPEYSLAYYRLLHILSEEGDKKRAMDLAEQVCSKFPDFACSYGWRAKIERNAGALTKAIEDADRAIAMERLAWVFIIRGRCYLDQGNNESALLDFYQAYMEDPMYDSENAKDYIKTTVKKIGIWKLLDHAKEAKNKAVELRKEWKGQNLNNVSQSEVEKYFTEASRELTCLLMSSPENKEALQHLGGLYYDFEEWDTALIWWKQLAALGQNTYYYWLCALALDQDGKIDERKEYCRRGLLCEDNGRREELKFLLVK